MIIGREPPCKSSVCSRLWHRYYRPVTRLRVYDCGRKLTLSFFIGRQVRNLIPVQGLSVIPFEHLKEFSLDIIHIFWISYFHWIA